LSGFIRSTLDEEYRLRQNRGYMVGQVLLGTVVNPANFVMFRTQAQPTIITKWLCSSAVVQTYTLFQVFANPGLAAGNSPQSRSSAGTTAQTLWQVAVAASPVTIGVAGAGSLLALTPTDVLGGAEYLISAGTGLLLQFPALAGNLYTTVCWFELPN